MESLPVVWQTGDGRNLYRCSLGRKSPQGYTLDYLKLPPFLIEPHQRVTNAIKLQNGAV